MRSKLEKFTLILSGAIIGILISINLPVFADKTKSTNLPIDELRTFAEVFGKIKSDYVEPVEDKKLINEALNGMLSGLDPHSTFLDKDSFKDLQQGTSGEFGGLGIEVGMEDGFVLVISPIEDTPAYNAGLKSGDLIMKLDSTAVKGLTLNEAVKLMRGKPGSSIILLSIATIILESSPPESKAPIGASLSNLSLIDFFKYFSNFSIVNDSVSFDLCKFNSQ